MHHWRSLSGFEVSIEFWCTVNPYAKTNLKFTVTLWPGKVTHTVYWTGFIINNFNWHKDKFSVLFSDGHLFPQQCGKGKNSL